MFKSLMDRLDLRASNLGRMMAVCGVDRTDLAGHQVGQTLVSVSRACMACPDGERCRRWLDSPEIGAGEPSGFRDAPAFCPNAPRFRTLRMQ